MEAPAFARQRQKAQNLNQCRAPLRLGSNGHLPGRAAAREAEGAIEALTAPAWAGTPSSEPGTKAV